ncbi:MAG: GSCFA domain-containing protein [Bacteroidia bacterium]|nr:GSCFA domain-containing protein [Bacteroidia bacterium]
MRFHLDHTPENPGFKLSHQDGLFLIGSCFSNNVGDYLNNYRFNISSNPNGILFNPLSISLCFRDILDLKKPDNKLILQRDEIFYSYHHHSSVSGTSPQSLQETISKKNKEQNEFLKKSALVIITFGSAYYYYHKSLATAVANCHKQPGQLFEKRILSVDEIVTDYSNVIKNLRKLNPNLKVMFTVSPVKYLRDGIIENNLSKSTLILAVHELVKNIKDCFYFPAFELVNDDLRDYRFYKEDLVHPNNLAIEYICQKFSDCFFDEQTQQINLLLEGLNKALAHRPITNDASAQLKLREYIQKQKTRIKELMPGLTL